MLMKDVMTRMGDQKMGDQKMGDQKMGDHLMVYRYCYVDDLPFFTPICLENFNF
jgi:hypothetical protein